VVLLQRIPGKAEKPQSISEIFDILEWLRMDVLHDVLTLKSVKMLSRAEKIACRVKDLPTMKHVSSQLHSSLTAHK
jgi:hypothetical protein